MLSYSKTNIFTVKELHILNLVTTLIETIPEYITIKNRIYDTSEDIRCHELARAVAVVIPKLKVIDGYYGSVEHSWLEIETTKNILDVYCVGSFPMVQLKHQFWGLPDNYKPSTSRKDIDIEIVQILTNKMRKWKTR